MPENRIKILQQFCRIIEKGVFLGTKIDEKEIINYHMIEGQYAIVHYSNRNRIINSIEWSKTLSEEEEKNLVFKPAEFLA